MSEVRTHHKTLSICYFSGRKIPIFELKLKLMSQNIHSVYYIIISIFAITITEDPKFISPDPDPDPAQLKKKSDPAPDPTLIRNEKKNIYILGR